MEERKYISPHEFYMRTFLKTIDVDKAYGGQCWDLHAQFCKEQGYKVINTTTGWAHELFSDREKNGILENFVEVPMDQARDGDWFFWQRRPNVESVFGTHVAMFRKWKDHECKAAIFLEQNFPNDGKHQYVTQNTHEVKGVIGVLRPKCYRVEKEIKAGDIIEYNRYNIRPYNNFHEEFIDENVRKGRVIHITNYNNPDYKNYNYLVEYLKDGVNPVTIEFVAKEDIIKQYLYE